MGSVEKGRIHLAFLCDDVRNELQNKISYMGVFGRFNVMDFEKPVPPFYVASQWHFDDRGLKKIALVLVDDNNNELQRTGGEILVDKEEKNEFDAYGLNLNIGISALKFGKAGRYFFVFKLEDNEIARLPILVEKA